MKELILWMPAVGEKTILSKLENITSKGLPLVSNDPSQKLKCLNKEKPLGMDALWDEKQFGTRARNWCGGNLHPAPKQESTQ